MASYKVPVQTPCLQSLNPWLWNSDILFLLTRMEGIAGDLGFLQSLGQLMGEENVAQLAIRVDLQLLHE